MSFRASFILLFLFSFLRASAQNFTYIKHVCPNITTFLRNSTYSTNHRALLSSLSSSNASYSTGFQSATAGQDRDRVTGLFLCHGDISPEVCRDCVAYSVSQSLILCPNEKEATLYYDECMLRFSDRNILSTLTYDGAWVMLNGNISTNQNQIERFGDLVSSTMNQAAADAANSSRKFYTMKANWTALRTLYVLAQCTPDLRRVDCLTCLQNSINGMPLYRVGGRTLYPSCNSRYELYDFYNETAITISLPPPLPPASTPPVSSPPRPGKGGDSNVFVVAIVVPIIVVVLLFIADAH